MGVELTCKTLGLIGCGNIGSIVADRALGLRMKVVAYDPFLTPERAVDLGVEKVDLDELLARADFITLHTPLTDQTRNILSPRESREDQAGRAHHQLRARRPDRRGGAQGRARERPCRRRRARRVRRGAGQGQSAVRRARADRDAASRRLDHRGAGQCRDPGRRADGGLLVRGGVTNALNMPSLSAEEAPRLRPYMELAEKLGSLVGQVEGRRDQRRLDRGRGRRRRSSTRSRSPAPCSPG